MEQPMFHIVAHGPVYGEDEALIVRRLGAAVALQWAAMPGHLQKLLLEQAAFLSDGDQTLQLRQEIEAFLRDYAERSRKVCQPSSSHRFPFAR